jgi:hypothetical protein
MVTYTHSITNIAPLLATDHVAVRPCARHIIEWLLRRGLERPGDTTNEQTADLLVVVLGVDVVDACEPYPSLASIHYTTPYRATSILKGAHN